MYKKIVNGQENLWHEYCRLRKKVKQLVIKKKLNIWNEPVEKIYTNFDENRKELWAFVSKVLLKSDTGLFLTWKEEF